MVFLLKSKDFIWLKLNSKSVKLIFFSKFILFNSLLFNSNFLSKELCSKLISDILLLFNISSVNLVLLLKSIKVTSRLDRLRVVKLVNFSIPLVEFIKFKVMPSILQSNLVIVCNSLSDKLSLVVLLELFCSL